MSGVDGAWVFVAAQEAAVNDKDYIRWFSDLEVGDVAMVGGKTASLGELYSALSGAGVKVPPGFDITAEAVAVGALRGAAPSDYVISTCLGGVHVRQSR